MIRVLLFAVFALAVGSAAAYLLRADTGYVMISYRQWILETSLFGLGAALFVGLCGLYYGFQLIVAGAGLPARLRRAIERRRADQARDSFEAGLLRLLEGHWRQAEIELVRRAADHHASHLNYLAAARAAQKLDAPERRDHYLHLAVQGAPDMEFATLLTQAELQRERGEFALARDTALTLREQDPRHPYAVELLADSHAALGEWDRLQALLVRPEAQAALSAERYRGLMLMTLQRRLRQAADALSLERLKGVWDQAAREFREVPEVQQEYARGLVRLNADAEAVALITATLNQRWDPVLMRLYGSLHVSDPLSQLAAVEQWIVKYGEEPEVQLAAGQVCLRNKLWGKARSYLEAAVRVAPTPETYLELARVCENTQNRAEADKFYRIGLETAAAR